MELNCFSNKELNIVKIVFFSTFDRSYSNIHNMFLKNETVFVSRYAVLRRVFLFLFLLYLLIRNCALFIKVQQKQLVNLGNSKYNYIAEPLQKCIF